MSFVQDIQNNGFAIVEDVLNLSLVERLGAALVSVANLQQRRGGVRNLLDIPEMRDLASSEAVMKFVEPVLGSAAFPVRGILFDKQEGANWKVPWHQDVTIAVKNRAEVDGYGPWSIKQEVVHVQPPANILEAMLSVRLHLDDCPKSNGALRVISGSHHQGKLSQEQIENVVARGESVTCEVRRGGVLLMRPLLMHASSVAESPNHRRVIHFDYANVALAGGLQWREVCS
jgi:ectoine hydroxylase-related dioxygenase (phytanoyl-CoA dioxygenase family)